jgi:tetratricopeptide (TPR) repeat protein
MTEQQAVKEDEILRDPAKRDYKQGRECLDKGDFNQAAIFLHNALLGFEEQGNEAGVANASDRLGDVCLAKKEFQLAIDNFKRAKEICQKEDDSFSLLALNKKIAGGLKKLGQLDEALELLFDIFEHYSLMRNPKGTVEILEVIAEVYIEKGDNEKAADSYRTIASIHNTFQHPRLAQDFEARAALVEQL